MARRTPTAEQQRLATERARLEEQAAHLGAWLALPIAWRWHGMAEREPNDPPPGWVLLIDGQPLGEPLPYREALDHLVWATRLVRLVRAARRQRGRREAGMAIDTEELAS